MQLLQLKLCLLSLRQPGTKHLESFNKRTQVVAKYFYNICFIVVSISIDFALLFVSISILRLCWCIQCDLGIPLGFFQVSDLPFTTRQTTNLTSHQTSALIHISASSFWSKAWSAPACFWNCSCLTSAKRPKNNGRLKVQGNVNKLASCRLDC